MTYKSRFLLTEVFRFVLSMEGKKVPPQVKTLPLPMVEAMYSSELSLENLESYVREGIGDFFDMLKADMESLSPAQLHGFLNGYHNPHAPTISFDLPAFRILESYEKMMDKRGLRSRANNNNVFCELHDCLDNKTPFSCQVVLLRDCTHIQDGGIFLTA